MPTLRWMSFLWTPGLRARTLLLNSPTNFSFCSSAWNFLKDSLKIRLDCRTLNLRKIHEEVKLPSSSRGASVATWPLTLEATHVYMPASSPGKMNEIDKEQLPEWGSFSTWYLVHSLNDNYLKSDWLIIIFTCILIGWFRCSLTNEHQEEETQWRYIGTWRARLPPSAEERVFWGTPELQGLATLIPETLAWLPPLQLKKIRFQNRDFANLGRSLWGILIGIMLKMLEELVKIWEECWKGSSKLSWWESWLHNVVIRLLVRSYKLGKYDSELSDTVPSLQRRVVLLATPSFAPSDGSLKTQVHVPLSSGKHSEMKHLAMLLLKEKL